MKKASIQLSTNFIVVMVLTILVIGMGFAIFGQLFDKINKSTETDINKECENYIEIALREDDVGFCKSRIEIEKGEVGIAWLGVYNGFDNEACYHIKAEGESEEGNSIEGSSLDTIIKSRDQKNLLIQFNTEDVDKGTYFVKVEVSPRNPSGNGGCDIRNIDQNDAEVDDFVKTLIIDVK